MSEHSCDIGFIGLGVMGQNLVLNLADNGYSVACFDLDESKLKQIEALDAEQRGDGDARVISCRSYTELLQRLKQPHLIMLSVPAGDAVEHVCEHLIAAGIAADDIVVDTGNSLWTDTVAREANYRGRFIFFSTAVSGGEVGARFGPSLMPSGDPYAWTRLAPVFNAIAAKVDATSGRPLERSRPGEVVTQGEPCSSYIGPSGSGHFVKMVHNGIEYADMQLICEAYHVMREGLGMTAGAIASVFRNWNGGVLDSYLMSITVEVLEQLDPQSQAPLVDVILDCAGQKGTGLWTAVSALEIGSPAQTITQAVYSRSISSFKAQRVSASKLLAGPEQTHLSEAQKAALVEQLHDALYCAKICAYAQGFQLLALASKEHNWQLNFSAIAKIWRAGCIIRAIFLQHISEAFDSVEGLENLLLAPYFAEQIRERQMKWRSAIAQSSLMGIPIAAMSSALGYYDAYRCETLPASLLQAQRDFFGAHTFERTDCPRGEKYHIDWSSPKRPLIKL
ncbi:MAG: NADP-dependent phosphogluconate dehydrogenase [Pseudomonadales bacterium]